MYLSGNHLSGELPEELGKLRALRFVNASSNNISGTLPLSVGALAALNDLSLFENRNRRHRLELPVLRRRRVQRVRVPPRNPVHFDGGLEGEPLGARREPAARHRERAQRGARRRKPRRRNPKHELRCHGWPRAAASSHRLLTAVSARHGRRLSR